MVRNSSVWFAGAIDEERDREREGIASNIPELWK